MEWGRDACRRWGDAYEHRRDTYVGGCDGLWVRCL